MFRNYLKIAYRSLLRNRVFGAVNIIGLVFGITSFAFIALWVWDEINVDKFHDDGNDIYQLFAEIDKSGDSFIRSKIPSAMMEPIISNLPEVASMTRVFEAAVTLQKEGLKFKEEGIYADSTFLDIFSFSLKEGKREGIFDGAHSVVLSQTMAEKYFSGESPLGKTIDIVQEERTSYTVTGVLEKIPASSSLTFDFILPYYRFENELRPWWGKSNKWAFTNYNVTGYFRLTANTEVKKFDEKLNNLFADYIQDDVDDELFSYPFTEVYLRSDFSQGKSPTGRIASVKLLSLVAFIVLIIACVNFINLSTAIAHKRGKEIGLRKTVGANKSQLVIQFLAESVGIVMLSLVVAMVMVELFMPLFNSFVGKSIELPFGSLTFILLLTCFALVLGLLAGVYPAIYLSSFDLKKVLQQGGSSTSALKGVRKGLVITQFTLSIAFIVFTFVSYDQIEFMLEKDLGIKRENVIYHDLNAIRGKQDAYKTEILNIPGVEAVSFTEQDPFMTSNANAGVSWSGKPEDYEVFFNVIQTGQDFIETFEIELLAGHSFKDQSITDQKMFIVNQAAVAALAIENPLGTELTVWGSDGRIVGVAKNYHHQSLIDPIEPLIILCNLQQTWRAFINIGDNARSTTIEAIQKLYTKYEQDRPFNYGFVEDEYKSSYNEVMIVGSISYLFSAMALFISCLGLFGLSTFVSEQRSKETCIRKVLGASERSLLALFSSEYLKLIVISFLIAAPITWYYTEQWLSDFSYHITLDFAPFILAGAFVICIALLTVFYNTLRVSMADPVTILKEN